MAQALTHVPGPDASSLMALADVRAGASSLIPGTQATILCCTCGAPMVWNPASMCSNCIRTRVDITEGIPKSVPMQCCRACGRFLNPPKHWVACQPESKELLSICLKRIKGLNKVKLIDASFIWTEPHSRRLKVDHKRTFYLLEQMILKYKAHQQTTSVKEVPDGIDFYFLHRNHAIKFQEFLTSVIPCRPKSASEKVLSEDLNNNKVNAKYTFSVEIVPICKDDVLCLHPRQHSSNGNIGPIVLCSGITQSVKLLDPTTMQRGELRQELYYKNPRAAIMTLKQATEYTVLDVELTGLSAGKMQQAELTLARTRDLGNNDEQFRALSHLGHLLQAGDTVIGYDFTAAVFNDAEVKEWPRLQLPDVLVVKKVYPEKRRRNRLWKLRSLIKEEEEGTYKSIHKASEADYERFLEDVDMDAEMRQRVNVYKDPARFKIAETGAIVPPPRAVEASAAGDGAEAGGEEEDDGDEVVKLEDMLDDLVLGDDDVEAVGQGLGGEEEEVDSDGEGAPQSGRAGPMRKGGGGAARRAPY